MSNSHNPSIERIRQCLREEEGKLFWLVRPLEHFKNSNGWKRWNGRFPGNEAGGTHTTRDDYVFWVVDVDYMRIRRSHIIWALVHGEWPDLLDHANRNSLDDRIDNLRLATQGQNMANRRRPTTNRSGFKGVNFCKQTRKWKAQIGVNQKKIYLGRFDTPEEAHRAYLKAARDYSGDFACGG